MREGGNDVRVTASHLSRIIIAIGLSAILCTTNRGSALAQTPICFDQLPTIIGTMGDDHLVGTDGPDVIVGLGGYDHIEGRGGDDRICGGPPEDDWSTPRPRSDWESLDGGAGHDKMESYNLLSWGQGGAGDDELIGLNTAYSGAGDDYYNTLRVDFGRSPSAIHVEGSDASGHGDDFLLNVHDILGSPFDDTIIGKIRAEGRSGNDVIIGTDRSDSLDGGRGSDLLKGEASGTCSRSGCRPWGGVDFLDGGPGGDRLLGGSGLDVLDAGPNTGWDSDVLRGGGGDDQLTENRGRDVIRGGGGDDRLLAGAGDDTLDGGGGRDLLIATSAPNGVRIHLRQHSMRGWGRDRVLRIEDLRGSIRADVLVGSRRSNHLNGVDGPDVIRGLAGDDLLDLGFGRAIGYGGPGWDRCYVTNLTRHYGCRAVPRT